MNLRLAAPAAILLMVAPLQAASEPATHAPVRTMESFDAGWLFTRGDFPAAQDPMFDDVSWRTVATPHDWGVEGDVARDASSGRGGGYRPTGASWYRRRFSLPFTDAGRRIFVEFDGVMGNSEVWINGQRVGGRPSGYVGFSCEVTGRVVFGDEETNILAVRTDTTRQPASRWYAGQGITRHVRLLVTDPVRIARDGLTVTAPEITSDYAVVRIRASVENFSPAPRRLAVRLALSDPDGAPAGSADVPARLIGIGETVDFVAEVTVTHPQLWDVGRGRLYRAAARVEEDGRIVDDDAVPFGIREFRFESATGFWLNGRNLKLKGVALHQDGGAVGDAVPLRVWERRLERLRTLGVNAIRTAHNSPAPDFLDLCDRMGFLVMDEFFDAWTVAKPTAEQGDNVFFTAWGRRDARDTIRRDRNHPSIILYSVGNEIHDTTHPALAKNILASLVGLVHAEDPTRPVTQALFRPETSHDFTNGLADMLDVIGANYRDGELFAAQGAEPARKILGTEERHDREVWLQLRDHPSLAGQFLWAGADYLGEADWPYLNSSAGLLGRTGRYKPRAWQRQSWWSDQPMVRIARIEPALADSDPRRRYGYDRTCDWTPRDPSNRADVKVEVYSNCDEVELTLNGRSLGSRSNPPDASPREWTVPFEPGTIRAVALNRGTIVATDELHTAGAPARLLLATDRPQVAGRWDDVAFVTVTAADAHGTPCPWADTRVRFALAGPGTIVAVDNGDSRDPTPFAARERRLFRGECVVLVKATTSAGDITLTASTDGMPDAVIKLTATP